MHGEGEILFVEVVLSVQSRAAGVGTDAALLVVDDDGGFLVGYQFVVVAGLGQLLLYSESSVSG